MERAAARPDAGAGFARYWCWRILGCDPWFAGALAAAELWLGLLWFFYWGYGVERGYILGAFLLGLGVLWFRPRAGSFPGAAGQISLPPTVRGLLIAALVLDVSMMVVSDVRSVRTSQILMDEGQTSWRAARLMWRGENPYGSGALTDLHAYQARTQQREAVGVTTRLSGAEVDSALARYDATLDARLHRELLPVPAAGSAAARELRLYGYKYGPLIVLITAVVAPFGIPAAVMFLNALACFGLYAVNWLILRRIAGTELALAGVAMLALLLDRHISHDYINRSATDVWPLLFGSVGVLAAMSRRPFAAAVAIALAVGCKTLPGLLFLPLLLRFRSPYPVLLFTALVGAIYLPWLLWDPRGILDNIVLWPFLMAQRSTSWEFFAPPWAALVARALALSFMSMVWVRYLFASRPRLFLTLALSNTALLLASGNLGNNYIPWASLWMVAALVEAFADRRVRGLGY